MIRHRTLHFLSLIAVLCGGLPVPSAMAARDSLTIGITQYPGTLNPMIDSMLAKTYVHGATQRQITIEGHDWTPICQLCVKLPILSSRSRKMVAIRVLSSRVLKVSFDRTSRSLRNVSSALR